MAARRARTAAWRCPLRTGGGRGGLKGVSEVGLLAVASAIKASRKFAHLRLELFDHFELFMKGLFQCFDPLIDRHILPRFRCHHIASRSRVYRTQS